MYNIVCGGGANFYPLLLRHKDHDFKRKHTYIHSWIRRLVLKTLHSSVQLKIQTMEYFNILETMVRNV